MPGVLKLQVTIPKASALPADAITNTFHWAYSAGGGEATVIEAAGALETFYEGIIGYFAGDMNFAAGRLRAYDLADPSPRAPVYDEEFSPDGSHTSDGLPAECAICVTWTADPSSGSPMARRRGRNYMGVLGRNTHQSGDTGHVGSTVVDDFSTAAGGLAAFAGTLGQLCVYSPTDGVGRNVTGGWVDNAYDTVRSRGIKATYRNPF